MKPDNLSAKRIIIISLLTIFLSAAFAIIVHAILPASVDVSLLDSAFVKLLGFPAVAVSYFLLLYVQCTAAVRYVCARTKVSNLNTGVRLGLSFALIYIFAMQEFNLKSSPFPMYGFDFIKYEFFMGLGDAIPVFILCIVIALFASKNNVNATVDNNIKKVDGIYATIIIAVIFLAERTIGYKTGIIYSDSDKFAIPTYVWTVLFGIILGCIYTILYPVIFSERKHIHISLRFILIIGVNWIIFNSFIGLILRGAMPQALIRSGSDVAGLLIALCLVGKFIIKPEKTDDIINAPAS